MPLNQIAYMLYRGAPTRLDDYMKIIRYALDEIAGKPSLALPYDNKYGRMVIVAGIPYSARDHAKKIKESVTRTLNPRFFGIIFQARATLIHEDMQDGIVCHIGHGTTELMAVAGGKTAQVRTIRRGVGDMTSEIFSSKTAYLDHKIFAKSDPEMAAQRRLLAAQISDVLEKMVIDFGLPVVCAGRGTMIPKLVSEIKNDIITNIRIAKEPIFSNALGMLIKAEKQDGSYR